MGKNPSLLAYLSPSHYSGEAGSLGVWEMVWRTHDRRLIAHIREMHIKTTMRYHPTPVRVASINKSTNKQVLLMMWRKENLCALLVRLQTGAATMVNSIEAP